MKVHVYERAFLWVGAALLVAIGGTLTYTTLAMGIHLPGHVMQVDPAQVRTLPPFDKPGLRQVGENRYEAVFLGSAWQFQPAEIRVPVGAHVTFIATMAMNMLHCSARRWPSGSVKPRGSWTRGALIRRSPFRT